MSDRSVYERMAVGESEVWGRILPDLERSDARAEDIAASAELRVSRHYGSLPALIKERGIVFEKGLTLGCGAGRLERGLLEAGICRSFHGVDISEQAIDEARSTAAREDLDLSYSVADLNFIELPEDEYDLVVAQTSLHHVLFLEHVAEQVWRTLKPDGYLWIHDFIGESQAQYEEGRLELINRVLAILPEELRRNRINGSVRDQIARPEPGHLGSPFESIRSEEIVPIFSRLFEIEWQNEFTAILHIVAPPGTRAAFSDSEETRAMLELLFLVDELCVNEGLMRPVGGQYLMRPKHDVEHGAVEGRAPSRAAAESGVTPVAIRNASRARSLITMAGWIARGRFRWAATFRALKRSGQFDYSYYLRRYEDVRRAGDNPLMHYIAHGAAEGRDPSAAFSTSRYVAAHPELAATDANPLLDHIRSGRPAEPI